ncbi:hypothetical protein BDK51DRAFT_31170 [Blyttiomyces helicus]|uniref:Uncharacterized protein n=1 Tax=Blyttiomyces helicus TaxID=388810 RepID=A0A4P9WEH2_9FUNG|nr:hypothetical protein BDK51DRAFT_31170 [Blyttiomyces helicus]|eukprot:RKO91121.1 hypothetical protein BDK51DRAFT_31170 [Blyttiomyces helicus]
MLGENGDDGGTGSRARTTGVAKRDPGPQPGRAERIIPFQRMQFRPSPSGAWKKRRLTSSTEARFASVDALGTRGLRWRQGSEAGFAPGATITKKLRKIGKKMLYQAKADGAQDGNRREGG